MLIRRQLVGNSLPYAAWPVAEVGETWDILYSAAVIGDAGGFTGFTHRQTVAVAAYESGAPVNGNKLRVTIASGTVEGLAWGSAYVGHAATSGNLYDFDGTQVQLLWAGSPSGSISALSELTSDEVSYPFDKTKPLVLSVYVVGPTDDTLGLIVASADFTVAHVAGDVAGTSDVTGAGATSGQIRGFSRVEVVAGESDEVQQFLDRISAPATPRLALYRALINGLVADGVWPYLDGLYILAADDTATANTNLRQSSYGLVNSGASFTQDRGYTGDGTSAIDTGYDIASAGGSFPADGLSGFLMIYSRTGYAPSGGDYAIEVSPGSGESCIVFTSGPNVQGTIGGNGPFGSTPTTIGNFLISRTGATAAQMYRNGATLGSLYTFSGSASGSGKVTLLNQGAGGGSTNGAMVQLTAAAFGGGLTGTLALALQARVNAYMTGLGISVY